MAKISVIVPVYKVEPYIRRCVDSILTQTFEDFEVILVDDGSPDSCGAICDEYAQKDCRVRVIHQKNGGLSNARNAGMKIMTGKYVTFCDSDDRYVQTWLQNLVTAMEAENADVTLGGCAKMLGEEEVDIMCQNRGVLDCESMNQKIDYCINRILNHSHGWEVWARLFRADVIRDNDIWFCEDNRNYAEDMGFTLEYACYASRIAVIPEIGYLYTVRDGSLMHDSVGNPRLDSVNVVAGSVLRRFERCFGKDKTKHYLPAIHYLMMQNQYEVMVKCNLYPQFRRYIKQIRHYDVWKSWSWKLFGCRKELQALLGVERTNRIMLNNFYHLFGIWPVFALGNELLERAERRSK